MRRTRIIRIPKTRFKLRLPTPFVSLPRRLSFFAFATTLITSLAVTWISVHSIHGFLREKIDQKFPAILGETGAKLDRWYDQRLANGEWPPVGLSLPLTMISVWNPDSR